MISPYSMCKGGDRATPIIRFQNLQPGKKKCKNMDAHQSICITHQFYCFMSRKKELYRFYLQNSKYLHGDCCELCNPISLCFFEGPEGGIGIPLGKNPKKLRGEFWGLGFSFRTWVCLEPWEYSTKKMSTKNSQSTRIWGLLPISQQSKRLADTRMREGVEQKRCKEGGVVICEVEKMIC